DFGDVADLRRKVHRHGVDGIGEILPSACDTGDVGLTAKATFGADFAGDAGDFAGKGAKLLDHGVERFFELQDFAANVDGDFSAVAAPGFGGGALGDFAALAGEVRRHQIDVVGEVLPGPADVGHLCLTAELAFSADFASHAGDLGSK